MPYPLAVVFEEQLVGHVAQLHLARIVLQQRCQLVELLAVSIAMATIAYHHLTERLVITVQKLLC